MKTIFANVYKQPNGLYVFMLTNSKFTSKQVSWIYCCLWKYSV